MDVLSCYILLLVRQSFVQPVINTANASLLPLRPVIGATTANLANSLLALVFLNYTNCFFFFFFFPARVLLVQFVLSDSYSPNFSRRVRRVISHCVTKRDETQPVHSNFFNKRVLVTLWQSDQEQKHHTSVFVFLVYFSSIKKTPCAGFLQFSALQHN